MLYADFEFGYYRKYRKRDKARILSRHLLCVWGAVLRIRIRRIHMFMGLSDPHPDLFVRRMDPDLSIIKHK